MKRKSVKTRVDFDDRVAKRYFKELNVMRQGEGGGEDRDSSEDENYPSKWLMSFVKIVIYRAPREMLNINRHYSNELVPILSFSLRQMALPPKCLRPKSAKSVCSTLTIGNRCTSQTENPRRSRQRKRKAKRNLRTLLKLIVVKNLSGYKMISNDKFLFHSTQIDDECVSYSFKSRWQ